MKWFNDLKIGTKLLGSFVLVAAIAGIIGWVGLAGVSQLNARSERLYGDRLVPIQDLAYANIGFLNARTDLRDLLVANDPSKRREAVSSLEQETRNTETRIEAFSKRKLRTEEQEMLRNFQTAFDRYKALREPIIQTALSGQTARAETMLQGEMQQVQAEARKELRGLIERLRWKRSRRRWRIRPPGLR